MQVPPEIAFRHMESSDELKELILEGIDDLEEVYPNLVSCRTVIADDTPGQQSGKNIRVRLDIGIPGKSVVVEEDNAESGSGRTVVQTLKDAFKVGRKRLKEAKARQYGDVKSHELPPHGRITRLLRDDTGIGYGFIESRDGRNVYFHQEALVNLTYEDLEIGDEVRIAVAGGDEGPQASTVAPISDDEIGPNQEKSVPLRS